MATAQMQKTDFLTELKARGWSRYADAELLRYIDWGLRDIARQARWIWLRSIIAVAALATEIQALTVDSGVSAVAEVEKIVITTAGYENPLTPMTDEFFFEQWLPADRTKSKGVPTQYFIYQDQVYVYPYPNRAYDYKIHVIYWPAFTNETTATSSLPEHFDEAILPAAEAYCFRRAREWDGYAIAKNEAREVVLGALSIAYNFMSEEDHRVIPYR